GRASGGWTPRPAGHAATGSGQFRTSVSFPASRDRVKDDGRLAAVGCGRGWRVGAGQEPPTLVPDSAEGGGPSTHLEAHCHGVPSKLDDAYPANGRGGQHCEEDREDIAFPVLRG